MEIQKIKYSKCPHCKQHGIKAFSKISHRHNPILTCKYCGKRFSVNIILSIFVKIAIPVFFGSITKLFFENLDEDILMLILYVACVLTLFLFEYFAPLEEIPDKK